MGAGAGAGADTDRAKWVGEDCKQGLMTKTVTQ